MNSKQVFVELNKNILCIKSGDDSSTIDISEVHGADNIHVKPKAYLPEDKHKIFLTHILADKKEVMTVYSGARNIFCQFRKLTSYSPVRGFVKLHSKVLITRLTKNKLKIVFYAVLVNKYKLNISDVFLCVDDNVMCPVDIAVTEKAPRSRINKLQHVHTVSFNTSDLLSNKDTPINSSLRLQFNINGEPVTMRIAMKNKRLQNNRLYYAPVTSTYTQDHAIHIRRTNKGTPVIVRRPMEDVEYTRWFRFVESKPVSLAMYYAGRFVRFISPIKVNIYYEKLAAKAEEGAFEVFEKAKKLGNARNYFVIDEHSPDYQRIRNSKNVVKKFSLMNYWLIYRANWLISTEAPAHLNILRSNNTYLRKPLITSNFAFLQHGITYLKNMGNSAVFSKSKEAECDLLIVNSKKEKNVVMEMMKLPEDRLLVTGMPIFANLPYKKINNNSADVLTIMLTWKPYEEYLDDFKDSSYYKNTIFLLETARKHLEDHQIQVVAHPKFKDFMKSTDISGLMWDGAISEVLAKTKLLITDYSSVCYNAFYQGAGVIFYQPDLDTYEAANGPLIPKNNEYIGQRCFNQNDMQVALGKAIKDGQIRLNVIRTDWHEHQYSLINEFNDGKNIERICYELGKRNII